MEALIDIEQGSDEWRAARCGIPTASCFGRILTPTGKRSTQADAYMRELLAEWASGTPKEHYVTKDMQNGTDLEPEARAFYEFEQGASVKQVGLVFLDGTRTIAASPDGLVGDNGGLEIKCPKPATHIETVLSLGIPLKYNPQVQGNLWVTGREWWDFLSYCPGLRPYVTRVHRKTGYIKLLSDEVRYFVYKMLTKRKTLANMGFGPENL